MIKQLLIAMLACGLALGTESFEKLPKGKLDSGAVEYGSMKAEAGHAEIHGKGRTGGQALRITGGREREARLLFTQPLEKETRFQFWVERWSGRGEFKLEVQAVTDTGSKTVTTLNKAGVGGFHTKVEGKLPAGSKGMKWVASTAEGTGVLVDDLSILIGDMKVKGVEIVNPGPYPIMKRALHNPVLLIDVQTEGADKAETVEKVVVTVDAPDQVASVTLRSGDATGLSFQGSVEYGSAKPGKGGKVVIKSKEKLQGGDNFLWLDVEPAKNAIIGSTVSFSDVKVTIGDKTYSPEQEPVTQRIGTMLAFPGETVGNQPNGADDRPCKAFRIPGIIRTEKGSLVASFDARYTHEGDLCADIDVAIVRSTDGGQTWSQPQVAMDAGPGAQNGCGDPCILQDKKGRLWIQALVCHFGGGASLNVSQTGFNKNQTGQWGMVYSNDDGKTWCKEYVNATEQVKKEEWNTILAGPGNGICTSKGYIVFPAQIWQKGANPHCRSTICYSKDNGKTWKMGNGLPHATSECQVVELKDGSIMINCRNEAGGGKRVIYVTKDMGETWEPHETNLGGIKEPYPQPCQGGFVAVETRKYGRLLLFSNPQVYPRALMIVRASKDEGKTWNEGIMYDKRRCMGYSCMAMTDPDHVGIIYETCHTNGLTGCRGIGFLRMPIEAIMTGENLPAKAAGAPDKKTDKKKRSPKSKSDRKKRKKRRV